MFRVRFISVCVCSRSRCGDRRGSRICLARISDTIADSADVPAEERLRCLEKFSEQVSGDHGFGSWPEFLIAGTPDERERLLLERAGEVLDALDSLSAREIDLIREVVGIIISGQRLDLERFGKATFLSPVASQTMRSWKTTPGVLQDAWENSGRSLATSLLARNSPSSRKPNLLKHAVDYGKSLQLVNILRDLPEDLGSGRCYLPVADPTEEKELLEAFSKWREMALERSDAGFFYSDKLESRRLRTASVLPAMIARETLELMEGADLDALRKRIKVPRRRVYSMLFSALFSPHGRELKRT